MARFPPVATLLPAAALLGVVVAAVDFLRPGGPVSHTAGALLVVVSTVLLLAAGAWLTLRPGVGWLAGLLKAAALLDLIGSGLAAGFLHAWLLLALMVVGLVGWLALFAPQPRRSPA